MDPTCISHVLISLYVDFWALHKSSTSTMHHWKCKCAKWIFHVCITSIVIANVAHLVMYTANLPCEHVHHGWLVHRAAIRTSIFFSFSGFWTRTFRWIWGIRGGVSRVLVSPQLFKHMFVYTFWFCLILIWGMLCMLMCLNPVLPLVFEDHIWIYCSYPWIYLYIDS